MRSLFTAVAVCSMLALGACQSSGHTDHAGHDHSGEAACCGTCGADGAKACSADGAKSCCGTCGGDAAKKTCPATCTKDCCAAKAK